MYGGIPPSEVESKMMLKQQLFVSEDPTPNSLSTFQTHNPDIVKEVGIHLESSISEIDEPVDTREMWGRSLHPQVSSKGMCITGTISGCDTRGTKGDDVIDGQMISV